MKIIIFIFILTSQAQYFDEEFQTSLSNFDTSTINLVTNEFNNNQTYETDEISLSSFHSTQTVTIKDQLFIEEKQEEEEEWFTKDNTSEIFWKKLSDHSTYILRSEGKCLKKMCYVKLKYNYLLSNKKDGCLSFILWTRGQPVGQLWIEEDDQQESFSQKIQLTNSSLHVQHSFKSNIKNLSIDGRILFENILIDTITLSDLNINFNGPCPIYSSIKNSTIYPLTSIYDQSTFEDDLIISTSEYYYQTNSFINNQITIETSTIKLNKKSSFLNQSNIFLILFLIVLFCLLMILSSIIYGIWTIQGHYHFIWYIPYNYPIQFISRTSIRSSTRSNYQIKTISQLSNEILTSSQLNFDF